MQRYDSIFKPGLFDGQVVIVTGGGSGIGRCVALELAALGATLVLVGRTIEKLETVAKEITDLGGSVSYHACDIRDEEGVIAVVRAVLEQHGRIDGLFNNAGGQFLAPLRDMKLKGFETVVRSNLTGGFIVMREVYVKWMEQHGGSIVNMAGDVGGGWPYVAHSGAARAGMINLTHSAAAEWARSGVRVNAIVPGIIDTSGHWSYTPEEKAINTGGHRCLMQRLGSVSETSSAIVFLLSPGAAFMTGTTVHVDGGAPYTRALGDLGPKGKFPVYDGLHERTPG